MAVDIAQLVGVKVFLLGIMYRSALVLSDELA
jgi:hypothetical protein